jgi:hypothetical protein
VIRTSARCATICTNTSRGPIFVFSKPRLLALMTDRPSAAYYEPKDNIDLWAYLRDSVQYITKLCTLQPLIYA